jgi:hypothetical protein
MYRSPEKPDRPLVAVVILNWNGVAHLRECIPSVERSSYSPFTIIVVDNASSDDSVRWLQEEAGGIHLLVNSENIGFARGNNRGIGKALDLDAAYILLLNNDTAIERTMLEELVNLAERDPSIGITGPKIYYWDDRGRIWFAGGRIDFWRGKIYHHGVRSMNDSAYSSTRDVDYITGCALMIKRDVVEKIGFLDPSYGIYTEDVDLCHRARLAGYRVVFCPEARMWHRISASTGGGLTPFKIYHKVRSNYLFFRRFARFYHWPSILFFVKAGALAFIFHSLFNGKSRSVVPLLNAFKDTVLGRKRRI